MKAPDPGTDEPLLLPPERGGPFRDETAKALVLKDSLYPHAMTLLAIKGPLESERAAVDTLSLELEILFPLGEMHTAARLATGALVQAYYVDDEIFKDFTILC